MIKKVLGFVVVILGCSLVFGQAQYKILWSFSGSPNDGAIPLSQLVSDHAGNLYGTTEFGGAGNNPPCDGGCGTVFKLSPNGDGTWTNAVIYSFCSNFSQSQCLDGAFPKAGLVFDSAGNLFGTTYNGGAADCGFTTGCGTVFELSPQANPGGTWTESVLYNFCSDIDNFNCLDGALCQSAE